MGKSSTNFSVQSVLNLCVYLQSFLTVGFAFGRPQETVALPTTPENDHLRMAAAGGPFKIALFADLHFGENAWTDWGPRQDVNSVEVMSTVLDHETPGEHMDGLNLMNFTNF